MSDTNDVQASAGLAGIAAILVAIMLGVLLGVFYGEPMWIASGGPDREVDRLNEIKHQKLTAIELLADEASAEGALPQEVRLRGQIQQIEERIAQVSGKDRTVGAWAGIAWELTKFIGDLFLQVLKLLVLPLVVTSMICGITSLGDIRKVGKVGVWTIVYYMLTGAIAVLIGIVLVQVIQPGYETDDAFAYKSERVADKEENTVLGTLLDVFRGNERRPGSGMFPSNVVQAAVHTNVLALIVFSLLFGAALTTLGTQGQIVIDFFRVSNEAVMKMVNLAMLFAPIGIFGLVAINIAKNGGGAEFGAELQRLGWYARRNPFTYTFGILRALLTAMTTASSSATLPVTMRAVERNNKVSNRSASFVLPLGATVNMDGTALYEAVAVIFIAQSMGIEMTTAQLFVIFLTATLAAIGAAGIPEAGLVTMVIVLTAVNLPMEGIGTILAIDWFLDRMRTTVNVYGDAVGAAVIDRQVVTASG